MPTYSYRCTECATSFDAVQAFTDDALTECPSCGGRLRKIFAAVGVTFNGSGFYRTDSKAGPASKSASGDAAGSTPKSDGAAASSTPAAAPAAAASKEG